MRLMSIQFYFFHAHFILSFLKVSKADVSFAQQVTESDAVDVVEMALKRHMTDVTTRAMSLIALLKLSSRFAPCSE